MACHKKTTQDFVPPQGICEHLNAFHMYAKDPKRFVETNHYCTHFTKGTYSFTLPTPCS